MLGPSKPAPHGDASRAVGEHTLLRRMRAQADEADESVPAAHDLADCLEMLERVWPGSTSRGDHTPPPSAAGETLEDIPLHAGFGRFEVRRLLGQGGFGAVFLVHDVILEREAALKIPLPSLLGSREMRQRFLREAQAAALLDHPNIVPIYETGESGPMWFIVSRYCSGPTLAAWLAGLPTPPAQRLAAQIIAALADAVHHAHSRGVLHRDLKPSNVLLEPADGADHGDFSFIPKLTDFGLAKRVDDQQEVTREGALLGTVRYMSPEQARGDYRAVGVQTDVYALGVMLYELISGQPPFHAHEAETLRCIQQEPIPALIAPHGRLSRDLVTVCLKCLEKDRAGRYDTAGELAAELRRYLAGQPVNARPVSVATRAMRWCRRRPVVAGLSAALALVLVATSIGSLVMLQRERELRRRAEWKQEYAIQAVGDFYTGVAENWLAAQPNSEELRKTYLMKALKFYEELAAEQSDDPEVRYRTSVALHRAANIQDHLRMPQEASRDRLRCLAILAGLIEEFPEERQYRFDRYYNLACLGEGYPGGRPAAVHDAYVEIRQLVAEEPDNPTYLDSLAAVSALYAANCQVHDRATATRVLEEGVALAEGLAARFPDRPLYEKNVAACLALLAAFAGQDGEVEEAARAHARCADIFARLANKFPDVPSHRLNWLANRMSRARCLEQLGKLDEAERELDECLLGYQSLYATYPGEVDVQAQLQAILWRQGEFFLRRGDAPRATEKFNCCIEFLEQWLREKSDYAPHRSLLASYLRECPIEALRNPARAAELEAPKVVAAP